MAWNKALENPAYAKSTWRSYEKWIVFFPISYTLDHVKDDKELVSWYRLPLLFGRCRVSSFLRVVWTTWRKLSKNKGVKFPYFQKNILFIVPGTLDPNLYECWDITYIYFFYNVHLFTPHWILCRWVGLIIILFIKRGHCVCNEAGTTLSAFLIL